ncbi:60S acidic ribosomal protein P2 [Lemmus lemmus]
MHYIASICLPSWGNSSPSAKDIKKILDSVGIEADDGRLNKVICELNGRNIEDVIAQGAACWWGCGCFCCLWLCSSCCWSCPTAAEEKKDEKKEESEELDDDMGFGLFDYISAPLQMKPFYVS